ncbi:MAG: hypothetical protein MK185_15850 [Saccharospirillaceae bacterium]|nr:hypothetical protein A3759_06895 [Thalassolituus sp. HI0120]MCH2042104.1 hypothetical protein [Saccharospirillaceae bacterium]
MLKWLFALLLPLISVNLWATERAKDLLLLEAHAYRLTADISILSLQEGGQRYQRRLDDTITSGNSVAERLRSQLPSVARQWHFSTEFVQQERAVAAANSDVNFTNDLAAVQRKLYQKIQQAKEKLSLEELNQSTAAALIAMIALEQMVAEYMSYNINVFGGHAVTDSRMADNAVVFRDSVAQITGHDANRKAIQAKWHFIEKTLLNYNQQSATFIVMKTTDKIRALLPV